MSKNEMTYTPYFKRLGGLRQYFVRFRDGHGLWQEASVSRAVYLEFQRSIRKEQSQSRWDRRYIERSELTDQSLYDRALHKSKSVSEIVLDHLRDEQVTQAIAKLPDLMRRRFLLYHDCGLTYEQIAEIEGCTKMPVKRSIDRAEEKIREKFQK